MIKNISRFGGLTETNYKCILAKLCPMQGGSGWFIEFIIPIH